ncbi:aldo/keto reductase [Actinokineospora globicatena]|uniref:Glyceraldehyde 3-phosphate reductase n=1 Tax=Actinokineospora globicatena TaxID=103729 RepID=A0A9W6V813_9PSEU|nr:glyceraldehyde 3-phosphate reductase [Actinokineospora globicatena]
MVFQAADDRYGSMTYRRCGHSGLLLPAVSLGLWHNFGVGGAFDTQRAILHRAFDLGVTHFDLANNYGRPEFGSAETTFGRVLDTSFRPYRDELVISTKAGYESWPGPYGNLGSRKYLLSSLDRSLRRLNTDYVDVFYSHRPDPDTPIAETMGALASAVKQGKALYAGISNYSPEQTRAAAAALASHGVPLLVHQQEYSMFEREAEEGLLDVLTESGTGMVAFSPLAQGLLTDRYLDGTIPPDARAATSVFLSADNITPVYLQRARALRDIAAERGQTLAQLALSWVLRDTRVSSVIIGASSVGQLEQNVLAAQAAPLTDAELTAINPHAVHGTGWD